MNFFIKKVINEEMENEYCELMSRYFERDKSYFENINNYAIRYNAYLNGKIVGGLGYYFVNSEFLKNYNKKNKTKLFVYDRYYIEVLKSPILDWGAVEIEFRNKNLFKYLLYICELDAFKRGHKLMIAGTIIPNYFKKNNYHIIESNTLDEGVTTMIKYLDYLKK